MRWGVYIDEGSCKRVDVRAQEGRGKSDHARVCELGDADATAQEEEGEDMKKCGTSGACRSVVCVREDTYPIVCSPLGARLVLYICIYHNGNKRCMLE